MFKKNFFKIILFFLFFNFVIVSLVDSQTTQTTKSLWDSQEQNLEQGGIEDAFGNNEIEDPRDVVVFYINLFFTFLGIIAVGIIIWSGILWLTSQGSKDKIDEAKQWMIRAIIGLFIILSSNIILNYVVMLVRTNYSSRNASLEYLDTYEEGGYMTPD